MFFTGELGVPAAYLHQTCEVLGSGREEAVGGMKDKGRVRVRPRARGPACVRACVTYGIRSYRRRQLPNVLCSILRLTPEAWQL